MIGQTISHYRIILLAAAPDVFYVTDHYLNYTSVLVRLSRVTPVCPAGLGRYGSQACDRARDTPLAIAEPTQGSLISASFRGIRERQRLIICNKQ
jgi:hypothetical protein